MIDNLYLQRYAYPKRLIEFPPASNLGIVVVIPCYWEPDLINSLQSIRDCVPPGQHVEVIVVINQPENVSSEIHGQNEKTWREALNWTRQQNCSWLTCFIVWEKELPKKYAGVGLARKIGMDEAVRRFDQIKHPNGIIVGFDADCQCDPNYLVAIEHHFQDNPKSPGCSIYFEHPLEGNFPSDQIEGIIHYELYLRYYVNALQFAGYPFAAQTIGSAMAVRSQAYQKQGGMNKREAGEDFYFLNKIMALGNYTALNTTRVIPSPRSSNRVPFGTGRAIGEWLRDHTCKVYAPSTFVDLRKFLNSLDGYFAKSQDDLEDWIRQMPQSIQSFFANHEGIHQLNAANRQSASIATFRKRFWQWFGGLKVLQFIHYSRDHFYPNVPVTEAASWLARELNICPVPISDPRTLLLEYRKFDRNGVKSSLNFGVA